MVTKPATGEYQPLDWQIVRNDLGFESIHETDEYGAPGDLVAHVLGDHAPLVVAAPRLRSALMNLLVIAGSPITERQNAVFDEARAVIADTYAA